MNCDKDSKALLGQLGDLPALPSVVTEVLRLTEDPDTDASDVTRAVQKDPALAAKVLRVSNSSYYGMKQYVGTLKLALVILGPREVRNIVLGISVFDILNNESDYRFAQRVWNESLRVAAMNKKLATLMDLGLQGEEFMSGLLCDIGRMALLHLRGEEYQEAMEAAKGNVDTLLQSERRLFGITHAETAAALSTHWNLPKTLTDALLHQYPCSDRSLRDARDPRLAAILRIARRALLDDFASKNVPRSLSDAEAWEILDAVARPIAEADRKPTLVQFLEEVEKMPLLPL